MRYLIFLILLMTIIAGCTTTKKQQVTKKLIDNPALSITPRTTVYAEATINRDGSITLTKVEKIKNPNITITFNLSKVDTGMMLVIENPLDKIIKYHLDMIDYKGTSHNTSSCPVMAGSSVYESWPHSIPEIQLSKAHVASKKEEGICVY